MTSMLERFRVLLLDMNDTFMFGADRFGADQDYSVIYHQLGGTLQSSTVNVLIQAAYDYLDVRYSQPNYLESFPALRDALLAVADGTIPNSRELDILIQSFAYHELGSIPPSYSAALQTLAKRFRLGLVTDIWAPKPLWIQELNRVGVLNLFSAAVFSSDSGVVKPSPHPFLKALDLMEASFQETLVIGDSIRRDLGGANAVGLPCLLVGDAKHPSAYGAVSSLLNLAHGEIDI